MSFLKHNVEEESNYTKCKSPNKSALGTSPERLLSVFPPSLPCIHMESARVKCALTPTENKSNVCEEVAASWCNVQY